MGRQETIIDATEHLTSGQTGSDADAERPETETTSNDNNEGRAVSYDEVELETASEQFEQLYSLLEKEQLEESLKIETDNNNQNSHLSQTVTAAGTTAVQSGSAAETVSFDEKYDECDDFMIVEKIEPAKLSLDISDEESENNNEIKNRKNTFDETFAMTREEGEESQKGLAGSVTPTNVEPTGVEPETFPAASEEPSSLVGDNVNPGETGQVSLETDLENLVLML